MDHFAGLDVAVKETSVCDRDGSRDSLNYFGEGCFFAFR
jgi:hypothetical protein